MFVIYTHIWISLSLSLSLYVYIYMYVHTYTPFTILLVVLCRGNKCTAYKARILLPSGQTVKPKTLKTLKP